LLAVADDAIGLGIIAVFYGDPANPANPAWLGLVGLGMGLAFGMRKMGVKSWLPYIFVAGPISWSGLMLAHLHPALALVPIVPFLPASKNDPGLFMEDEADHSTLHMFEHQMKLFVDLGLFFFAFANAGVQLAGIGPMTWIILLSLVIGKTGGITCTGLLAQKLGFKLPGGMDNRELLMAGFVAALGLTVALFVAGAAFIDPVLQGQAKMGALFSGFVGVSAILLARILGFGTKKEEARPEAEERPLAAQAQASAMRDRSVSVDVDSVAAAIAPDARETQAAPPNKEQSSH